MSVVSQLTEAEQQALERLAALEAREDDGRSAGLRKAAILLLALDNDVAAEVFQSLPDDEIEAVSQEIARLGMVNKDELVAVLEEFRDMTTVQGFIREGGYDHAIELIQSSLPKAKANKLVRLLEAQRQAVPFHFLEQAEAEVLATFLQEEHPQTIALVVSYMEPNKAADILTSLPHERQFDILKRVATLGHTSPEAIKHIESGLRKHLASLAFEEYQDVGGVKTVSEILNVLDRATERLILENIEEENPELAAEIKKLMFVFEDLLLVDDRGIQNVLKEIDNQELALALKAASEELKEKIFHNMSRRASELIQEEINYMGPVRISDVESAQQNIVEVVRRLEETGDVVIMGRGGESNILV